MAEIEAVKCKQCEGIGECVVYGYLPNEERTLISRECDRCGGTGIEPKEGA